MEITVDDLKNFWKDSLKPLDASLFNEFLCSQETKSFLVLIGIPIDNYFLNGIYVKFYSDPGNIKIFTYLEEKYISIGNNEGDIICIKEKTDEVFVITDNEEVPIRFINSNISNILIFFQIYFLKRPELRAISTEEEALEIVNNLKNIYSQIDPKALYNVESWWSIILEQTEQGLM